MSETLPATPPGCSSAALPERWINTLFDRLAALYGRHWFDLWADVPIADVKDAWSSVLAGMTGEQIRHALDHCARGSSKYPPTAPEFAALCRAYRVDPAHRPLLPQPRLPMPEHVRAQLRAFLDKTRMPV